MQNAGGIYTSIYDELGRVSTVKNPAAKSITYSYDANSNRSSMIDPDGGRFTYAYDARSALKTLKNPQNDLTTFSYDANGQRTLKKLTNGTRASHTYDAVGNLEKLYNFKSNNSVISSFDYSNNAINNRTSVVESNGDRVTWTYDNTSQLLSEHRSGANAYSQTYTYDAAGNRTTKKVDNLISTYTFDKANQIITCEGSGGTSTFTFDNNGNQRTEKLPGGSVTTNTWDFENHLTIIEQPAVNNITYSYNPDGLRVEKNNKGTVTKFVWDDQAYLAETDNSDVTSVVYSNEPSQFGDLISQRRSSTNFFHFDALGSTRELTTSDESITDTLIYSAWGEEINRTGVTDVDFQYVGSQGYYHDSESNSFYIRARIYNSNNARWMSKDPLGLLDSINMFLYSSNNPIDFTDPSGQQHKQFPLYSMEVGGQIEVSFDPCQKPKPVPPKRCGCDTCELQTCCDPRFAVQDPKKAGGTCQADPKLWCDRVWFKMLRSSNCKHTNELDCCKCCKLVTTATWPGKKGGPQKLDDHPYDPRGWHKL